MFTYDGIRSQLEWNSTLSVSNAPQPTAETKYLRKVSFTPNLLSALLPSDLDLVDFDHCDHRCAISLTINVRYGFSSSLGPNTNTVEKLAALRRAGVNVGQ